MGDEAEVFGLEEYELLLRSPLFTVWYSVYSTHNLYPSIKQDEYELIGVSVKNNSPNI